VAYVAAGRSSYLDGGILLYGLNPRTGKVVCQARVRGEHPGADDPSVGEPIPPRRIAQNTVDRKTLMAPDKSDSFSMAGGVRPDVLVSDGSSVYLHQMRFDRQCVKQETPGRHLFSTTSLLDPSEVHRTHMVLGTGDFSRMPVAYSWIANALKPRWGVHLAVPYGLLLAFDEQTAWGVRRAGGYVLFAEKHKAFAAAEEPLPDFRKPAEDAPPRWTWSSKLAMRPRALVRAGERLFLAGMPGLTGQQDSHAAFEGRKGGLLVVASAADGKKLWDQKLDSPPVWDGMAAASGRLFISTLSGHVVCLSRKQ
jgi:hypothetical protein